MTSLLDQNQLHTMWWNLPGTFESQYVNVSFTGCVHDIERDDHFNMMLQFKKQIDRVPTLGRRLQEPPSFMNKNHMNFDYYKTPKDEYFLNDKTYDVHFMFKDPKPESRVFSKSRGVYPRLV